jgi:hypothetical protein
MYDLKRFAFKLVATRRVTRSLGVKVFESLVFATFDMGASLTSACTAGE